MTGNPQYCKLCRTFVIDNDTPHWVDKAIEHLMTYHMIQAASINIHLLIARCFADYDRIDVPI